MDPEVDGHLLMTSKTHTNTRDKCDHQQGVNHISDPSMSAAPYYDWMLRYAQSFKKLLFGSGSTHSQRLDSNQLQHTLHTGHSDRSDRSLLLQWGEVYGDERLFHVYMLAKRRSTI